MTINEHQTLAMTTLNPELARRDVLINSVMGLCGESGEAIDIVKKWLAQGHELDKEHLAKELGDIAWYLAEAAYALDQEEHQSRYDGLVERFQKLQEEYDSVTARIAGNMARKKTMEQFIGTIETQEPITKFDEGLWSGLVDFVTVYSTKDIRVTFKDGMEI